MVGKQHRKKKAGAKADKRSQADKKKNATNTDTARQNNPKAFTFKSRGKAKAQLARSAEKEQNRLHAPVVDRTPEEPPPFVVLVHGPPQVGKSTLIKCLVKHFTRQTIADVKGPITVVAGKKRRLTFIECPPDLNSMIDAAKFADLVLLMVDGSFGFEMETFEFLNLLQVHGFPKVMGVLTHLDGFKDQKRLRKTKKSLKARFWTEIYDGAKLFYLSGVQYGKYLKREVLNLARFISVMKFRPLAWRIAHPYLLADRFEDITPREVVRLNPKCDRDVALYGFLRGTNLKPSTRVHIAGVGDYTIQELEALPDPCPLPDTVKRRGLNEKERLLYAPMADVGGLLYDRDAVYIDIPDWKVQFSGAAGQGEVGTEGETMVRKLQGTQEAVDEKLRRSQIQVFEGGRMLGAEVDEEAGSGNDEDGGDDDESDEGEGETGSDTDEDGGDEDEEWSDNEGTEREAEGRCMKSGMPSAHAVAAGGRVRRRAVFGGEMQAGEESAEDEAGEEEEKQEEEDSDEGGEEDCQELLAGVRADNRSVDSGEDSEGLGGASRWKAGLAGRAASLFSRRGADLQALIYSRRAVHNPAVMKGSGGGQEEEDRTDYNDGEELFTLRRRSELGASTSETGQPGGRSSGDQGDVDVEDCSRLGLGRAAAEAWESEEAVEGLRDRFVTGSWEAGQRRAGATPDGDEGSEEEDVFDDFEDVETGEVFKGGDAVTAVAQKAISAAAAEELRIKKAAKKAAFDAQYDTGGKGAGEEDEGQEEGGGAGPAVKRGAQREEEETFYDSVKRDMTERQAATRAIMESLDPRQRAEMEGYRPGVYVRIRFSGVACELVEHLDPHLPLLLGGLGQGEEKLGYMRLRFKRHRWSPKILKNRDPLVFSIGWRRFQSLPVFSLEDHNRRLRMLKYTPEHMHCIATVFGPLAPPNTGVAAVQNLASQLKGWRISATGVVVELDAGVRVVKKIKLVGTPFKIHRHTAFVGGMFTSRMEAVKFEGAAVRTVSGIRGTIKKALRPGVEGGKDGSCRITFEDKPLLSDIVFLRAWVAVELPRFYNPVTNLLMPQQAAAHQLRHAPLEPQEGAAAEEQKQQHDREKDSLAATTSTLDGMLTEGSTRFQRSAAFAGARPGFVFQLGPHGLGYYQDAGGPEAAPRASILVASSEPQATTGTAGEQQALPDGWVGMRTVAQLRRELGVGAPRNSDSLYRGVNRAPRKFNPLKVPKKLQAALPFKSKPKLEAPRKRKSLRQKRAVVLEPQERKAYTLLQQLNAIRNDKAQKRREAMSKKKAEKAKQSAVDDAARLQHSREERKKRYRDQGQAEKRAEAFRKTNKRGRHS